MATSPLIDNEMVDEVVKLGFAREEIVQSVKARQQNKVRPCNSLHSITVAMLKGTACTANVTTLRALQCWHSPQPS